MLYRSHLKENRVTNTEILQTDLSIRVEPPEEEWTPTITRRWTAERELERTLPGSRQRIDAGGGGGSRQRLPNEYLFLVHY